MRESSDSSPRKPRSADVINLSERKPQTKRETAEPKPAVGTPTLPTPAIRDEDRTGYDRAVRRQTQERLKQRKLADSKATLRSTLKVVTEENADDVRALTWASLREERIKAEAQETPLSGEEAGTINGVSPEEIAMLRSQVEHSKETPPEVAADNVVDLRLHRTAQEPSLPVSRPEEQPTGLRDGWLHTLVNKWLKLD